MLVQWIYYCYWLSNFSNLPSSSFLKGRVSPLVFIRSLIGWWINTSLHLVFFINNGFNFKKMYKAGSPSYNKNTVFRNRIESQTSRKKSGSRVRINESSGQGVSVQGARQVFCRWMVKVWIRPDLAIWPKLEFSDRVDSASSSELSWQLPGN